MPVVPKNEVAGLVAGLTAEDATACNAILERLKHISNTKSDTALARALGLKQSSVSTAKTRGMVPSSWIINAAKSFNVSADWLIFGDEKYQEEAPAAGAPLPTSDVIIQEEKQNNYQQITKEWALDLNPTEFEKLWDTFRGEKEARRGWLQIEIITRFPEFLDWLKKQPEPVFTPSPAAIKMAGQTRHYGLPDQLEDD